MRCVLLDLASILSHVVLILSLIGWSREAEFSLFSSGTCERFGWTPVSDAHTCQRAAELLGLPISSTDTNLPAEESNMSLASWEKPPSGCYKLEPPAAERGDGAELFRLHHSPPTCGTSRRRRPGETLPGGLCTEMRTCICECSPALGIVASLVVLAAPLPLQWYMFATTLRKAWFMCRGSSRQVS